MYRGISFELVHRDEVATTFTKLCATIIATTTLFLLRSVARIHEFFSDFSTISFSDVTM